MNCLSLKYQFKVLTQNFKSCSIVNADGALLYSKDLNHSLLTTTRLVAFQIVKKYLRPQPHDLFILNDPENGGFQYSKLIFMTSLTANLFVIWDEDFNNINFKIPPTPLYDQGVKNEFVWKALIGASPFAEDLETFILFQKSKIEQMLYLKEVVENLSSAKSQQAWLKATQQIFDIQFNNKAQGGIEAHYKLNASNQTIKLKFSAEEKQNLKLFTLDLTNTNLATDVYAASHIVESAMVKKIIDFYEINDYFTQSILDKIKIILPPRSIVSKAHPTGLFNLNLQAVCSQLCDHLLTLLNSPTRKAHSAFSFNNFLTFNLKQGAQSYNSHINKSQFLIDGIEQLSNTQKITVKTLKKGDDESHIVFQITCEEPLELSILNSYETDDSSYKIKINDSLKLFGTHTLNKNDLVEFFWSHT